ncbi:hypothetical protein ACFL3Y_02025 [Pseudomonadota bacterium]
MSDLMCKEADYEGSSLAKASGLLTKTHIEKVYQWRKCVLACIDEGVFMLLLSPFCAFLAIFRARQALAEWSQRMLQWHLER